MKTALRVCGVIALTVTPVDGSERLPLTITPTQAFAPAAMRIRARIEPNADNRVFAIVADGNEFYRRSDIQLDGRRLVTRADGVVTFAEINAHLDIEQRNRDLDRPELIDARGATTRPDDSAGASTRPTCGEHAPPCRTRGHGDCDDR